jgi:hypothetical protein
MLAAAVSCKHEPLPTYSGEDMIYFAYAGSAFQYEIIDSMIVKFGYDAVIKTDSVIEIGVKLMGDVKDYDRPVAVAVDGNVSTALSGTDVELLPELSLLPAGKIEGKILLRLKNTERLNDTSLLVALRLKDNEHFKAEYTGTLFASVNREGKIDGTKFRVRFDNGTEMPSIWANATLKSRFDMIFGAYSNAKFNLMCQILPGCSHEYFTFLPGEEKDPNAVFSRKFPMGLLSGWAIGLNMYLNTYKAEHDGEPLRDENGNEIKSGNMFT